MDKAYDSIKYEKDIYQAWIKSGIGLYSNQKSSLVLRNKIGDKPRIWDLNFRNENKFQMLNSILNLSKTIETRALNPNEPEKFFGEINPSDTLCLHDIESKKKYYFKVHKTEIFTSIEDAFNRNFDFQLVAPDLKSDYSIEEVFDIYIGLAGEGYLRQIQEHGFIAIYLGKQLLPKENQVDFNHTIQAPSVTSFIMPPPNLTGSLHLGHVLQHSIYDTYLRYNLMQGKNSLFLPGVDHAGIQFEGKIEKDLKKEGTNKEQIGFDKFIDRSWKAATESKDNIKQIAQNIGELPAWDKMHFTLDDASISAVRSSFYDYWQKGWVYKGTQMVNWSVGLQTAVSEVFGDIEWEERIDPFVTFEYEAKRWQSTNNWKVKNENLEEFALKYLKSPSQWKRLQLSTVRMETKFTDLAVAMHPSKFEIYFNLEIFDNNKAGFEEKLAFQILEAIKTQEIHVFYHLPALDSDELKLVLSDKVLADFGTGILKITPAHDPFDYQMFLEFVEAGLLDKNAKIQQAVGRDGKLTQVCGEYAGLTVEEARPRIIKRLIETGYIPNKNKNESK